MKKILVVDDELHITALLTAVLEMSGYKVLVVSDGLQCLELLETETPDLIVLDVKMPGMDGWTVCKKLKSQERTKAIPVIIVTAFGQQEDRDKSFAAGANAFLPKPFDNIALLEKIRELLSQ